MFSNFKVYLNNFLRLKSYQKIIQLYNKRITMIQERSKFNVIKTLLYKNYLVFKGNLKKYLLIYFSPVLIFLLIMLLQFWTEQSFLWQRTDPPIMEVSPFPKCTIGKGKDRCVTLAYIVHGNRQPQIDYVIDYIKKQNNLSKEDVKELQFNPIQLDKYFQNEKNRNVTQALILFCTDETLKYKNLTIPCSGDDYHVNFYILYMNVTLFHKVPYFSDMKGAYPKDQVNLKLKKDIDQALVKFYYNKKYGKIEGLQYSTQLSSFPSKASRFVQGISIMGNYGAFFIMIPYLILLVMESSQLLKQKQGNVRIGLNIVGVSHFQFYFAEMLYYFFSVLVITINFTLFGWLFNFQFWTNGIISFNFFVLAANGFIIGLLAFCVTAAVSQKNLGMSIIYGFVLYSVIMENLLAGGMLLQVIYLWDPSLVILIFRILFNLYPAYHFSKIFFDVQRKAGTFYDNATLRYMKGEAFTYQNLFEERTVQYDRPFRHGITVPSTFQTTINLLLTSILLFVALYLLDILVQSNRGHRGNLLCSRKKARKQSGIGDQQNFIIRINNLQKYYNKDVFALKGVTFDIAQGEIVSLLGQNGAGKSTLINILIGALSSSSGKVFIDGYNVSENIDQVRKILGVCPQFDILWQDISAYDHMYIFSRLKGVNYDSSTIQEGLEKVSLWKNRDGKVSTFSGGMKRRLSLAISFIGSPKLIVLDQPTTGMDVKIRLQTWKTILSMRGKTTILITTHNMEQSECLSDRILIMNKGRIVAQGSSLSLKKQFGAGYVIKGIDPQTKDQVVIKCKEEELETQLESIEAQGLQNWSLRQTTLQQVFLNAIKKF